MGSSVPTAAPDHGPLPGADRGQGLGAAGPGEVRHRRHRVLLQSLQGEDVPMIVWCLNSLFHLKVTRGPRGFISNSHIPALPLERNGDAGTAPVVPPDWKIIEFPLTVGIMGAVKAEAVEVNLTEPAEYIDHFALTLHHRVSRCDRRL